MTYLAAIFGALILLIGLGLFFVFRTNPGHDFLVNQTTPVLEKLVAQNLNSELKIGTLTGQFPEIFTIDEVTISADGQAWLILRELHVELSLSDLAAGKLNAEAITAKEIDWLAKPPAREKEPKTATAFNWPKDLPDIRIGELGSEHFHIAEAVFGIEKFYSALGQLNMGGSDASLQFDLVASDKSDNFSFNFEKNKQTIKLDNQVFSNPEGLLGRALKISTPLEASLIGESTNNTGDAKLTATIPGYGQTNLDITLTSLDPLSLSLRGPIAIDNQQSTYIAKSLGPAGWVDVDTAFSDKQIGLKIKALRGSFGSLRSDISIDVNKRKLTNLQTQLRADISESFAQDIQLPQLAGQSDLSFVSSPNNKGFTFEAMANVPFANIQFKKGSYANTALGAEFFITATNIPYVPEIFSSFLQQGVSSGGDLSITSDIIDVKNIQLHIIGDERDKLSGKNGYFTFDRTDQSMKGEMTVLASDISDLVSPNIVKFTGALEAKTTFTSQARQALLDVVLDYPAGLIGKAPFSSGSGMLNLASNENIAGNINFRAKNNSHQGEIEYVIGPDGGITLPTVKLQATDLTASGSLLRSSAARREFRFDFNAQPSFILPSGQALSGTGSLTGEMAATGFGKDLSLHFTTPDMRISDVEIQNLSLNLEQTKLGQQFTLKADDTSFGDNHLEALNANGVLATANKTFGLTLSQANLNYTRPAFALPISLTQAATISLNGGTVNMENLATKIGTKGTFTLDGSFSNRAISLKAMGTSVQHPNFPAAADFVIVLDTEKDLPGTASFTVVSDTFADGKVTLQGSTQWDGEAIALEARIAGLTDSKPGTLSLTWPVKLITGKKLSIAFPTDAISGQLEFDNTIRQLYAFLPIAEEYVTGRLSTSIMLSGTSKTPIVNGTAKLSNGHFEESRTGITVNDISGDVAMSYNGVSTEGSFNFTGADAEAKPDTIKLTGSLSIPPNSEKRLPRVEGELLLNKALLLNANELTMRSTALLKLTGQLDDLLLAGKVDLISLDALIPETPAKSVFTPVKVVFEHDKSEEAINITQAKTKPSKLQLDISIKGDRKLFLRGRGLTSEWKTDLSISGTARQPILIGSAEILSGVLDFAGRRFDIDQGKITFARGLLAPTLSITANQSTTTDTGTLQTQINVTGSTTAPKIAFNSTPSLPQEDILSYLLFGKRPDKLSATESLRVASALAEVSGVGIGSGDILNIVRRSIGVDRLAFGQNDKTGLNEITVGKYVSDEVFVSATQDIQGTGGEVTVTYEVTDQVNIETTVEQNGAQSVSANYKKDY